MDADVYEWAHGHRWYARGGYVVGHARRPGGAWGSTPLHRIITLAPPGADVDHINRIKLDNRRCNLRVVTSGQNRQNTTHAHSRSGVRGVYWDTRQHKWFGQIVLNYRLYRVGTFATIEEAATAVAEARLRLHPFAPVPPTEAES